jgi:excisionase family DNA binding protein
MTDEDDGAYSVHTTAERFGVYPGTVYRHLAAGTFPCRAVRIGRVWRISAADVEDYLRRRRDELGEADG